MGDTAYTPRPLLSHHSSEVRLNIAKDEAEVGVEGGNPGKPENIESRELLVNEFSRYNLFLLRNIYDAYEEKGDRVVSNFRKGNFNILKKSMFMMLSTPFPRKFKKYEEDFDENGASLAQVQGVPESAERLTGADSANEDDPFGYKRDTVSRRRIDKYGKPIEESQELSRIEDKKDLLDTKDD